MAHTELGRKILDRLEADLGDLATVDQLPKLDGRNMIMVLAPVKKAKAEKPQPGNDEPTEKQTESEKAS
jgi:translation initiation factor IF-3